MIKVNQNRVLREKGGGRDEEDSEQEGSCQGGRFLERYGEGGKRESWQGMPQVKGLKELKLLVKQRERRTGRRREVTEPERPARPLNLVFLLVLTWRNQGSDRMGANVNQ